MLHRSLFALIASAAIVTPVAAQRVETYDVRPDGPPQAMAWGSMTASRRAIIGVTVGMRPSPGDSTGATIAAVTPGGPAARAGLLAGDIITKFNGTALVTRGQVTEDDDQSAPGMKLVELVARVEPGDTVVVEWRHDRQRKTAKVATESGGSVWASGDSGFRVYTSPRAFSYTTPGMAMVERDRAMADLQFMVPPGSPPEVARVFLRMRGPLGGVQFAPINADLGRYFGVTDGILILDTPDTSAHVDLKGGDVIVGVDNRKATDVDQLMRILGSYNDDESINFDVMRDKKHVTVTVKASEIRGGGQMTRMKVLEGQLAPMMRTPSPDMIAPPVARQRTRSGT